MEIVSSPCLVTSPFLEKEIEVSFYEKDSEVRDPVLAIERVYVAIHFIHSNVANFGYYLNLIQSNMDKEVVPQSYNLP